MRRRTLTDASWPDTRRVVSLTAAPSKATLPPTLTPVTESPPCPRKIPPPPPKPPKRVPPGPSLGWGPAEIAKLSEVGPEDLTAAHAHWRRLASKKFKTLLAAKKH